jgi:hypothetical protein
LTVAGLGWRGQSSNSRSPRSAIVTPKSGADHLMIENKSCFMRFED